MISTISFQYRANVVPGPGIETLRIDPSSTPPLTPGGVYYVRIGNNTGQRVNFTATVTFEFDNGPAPLTVTVSFGISGRINLQWFTAEPGATYIIEATDNLGSPTAWRTVGTQVATSTFETFDVPPAELGKAYRFFRIRRQ